MLKSTKQPSIQELLITFDWECLPGGLNTTIVWIRVDELKELRTKKNNNLGTLFMRET